MKKLLTFIGLLVPLFITAQQPIISSSSDHPPNETDDKAFDLNYNTKWFAYGISGFLQIEFETAIVFNRYNIVSANDEAPRDPKDWKVQGSNNGSTWFDLDTQTSQVFVNRYELHSYNLSNNTAYKFYKLNISANNGSLQYLQLADFTLMDAFLIASECNTLIENNLSDLTWVSAQQGYGTIQKDTNIEGGVMAINGQTFTHGIGTHAESEIIYDLSGSDYQTFKSYIGVDDAVESTTPASVQFEVLGDGVSLFRSQTMTGADNAQLIEFDITDIAELTLIVDAMGPMNYDHADWAGAVLISCGDVPGPSVPILSGMTPTGTSVALHWTASTSHVSIANYNLYQDGVLEAELGNVLTYEVTGLTPESTYDFTVTAVDVDGNESLSSNTVTVTTNASSGDGDYWVLNNQDVFYTNGNVGIGTSIPDSKLTVKGSIHSEEVKVDLSVPAPDYVFDPNYRLTSLEKLKEYIIIHGHLPNMPSAKEMETNGIQLGIMNMKLLEKIEELTLYIFDQQTQLDLQKEENTSLRDRLVTLERLINKK